MWEIVPDTEFPDKKVTCYKREVGSKFNVPIIFDHVVDEDTMGQDNGNFAYPDWKSLIGAQKLKSMAASFSTEQSSLPIIYWMKYVMGFNDDSKMERINSTRYIFRK